MNFNSNKSCAYPPPLAVDLPSFNDVTRFTTMKQPDLPIDVLLVTVKHCEFLACYNELKYPFGYHFDGLGCVYFADFGSSQQERVKVALVLKRSEGSTDRNSVLICVKNAASILHPKALIFVGTCSGLNPDITKLGDVIVSTNLTTYASKVKASDQEQWVGIRGFAGRQYFHLTMTCGYGWKRPPLKSPEDHYISSVHCKDFLSGPEQIRTECWRKELVNRHPSVGGVDVEGEGFIFAAFDLQLDWLIVKGIADFVVGEQVNAESWETFASVMAASLVSDILHDPGFYWCTWPDYYSEPHTLSCYPMTSQPRGICLIVNNLEFEDKKTPDRYGAERDEEALHQLFEGELGFKVHVENDKGNVEMLQVAQEFAAKDHSEYCVFVCFLMSHGGDHGTLEGVRGRAIRIEDITSEFTSSRCPSLANKPKLFIIQACRGKSEDPSLLSADHFAADSAMGGLVNDSTLPRSDTPSECDFLYAHSTVPGYVSKRIPTSGSPFIQTLVDVIREFRGKEHFSDMLGIVNNRLSDNLIQVTALSTTLRRKLYL